MVPNEKDLYTAACLEEASSLFRQVSDARLCLQAQEKQAVEGKWGQAPWHCVSIIRRSQLASRIAVCVCLSGFVALGFMEMLSQYLELKLQYTKLDLVRALVFEA